MKVVHLLRKPCSEGTVAANVLRWGTGALNIDAARVAHDADVDMGAVQRQQATGGNSSVKGAFGAEALVGKEIPLYKPGGRWPANLVLQHLDGCRQNGSKTVKGAGHYPSARSAGSQISGPSGHTGQVDLTERHLKEETVAAWVCVEGCPVAALDRQSGECRSTMTGRGPIGFVYPNPGRTNGRGYNGVGGGGGEVYADTGGASRFFKHFHDTTKE